MKNSVEITDVKLKGNSPAVIRRFFFGATLLLAATLLGATIASRFDATLIKLSLAIMTIPAYVFFFLSRFCYRLEIKPANKSICFYPLLKKVPTCFDHGEVSSIRKKGLQGQRFLYQFKVGKSRFTLCADRQGVLEKHFPDIAS